MVTAVAPVVIKGNGLWVGWPGIHTDDSLDQIPESDPEDQTPTAGLRSEQVTYEHTYAIKTYRIVNPFLSSLIHIVNVPNVKNTFSL